MVRKPTEEEIAARDIENEIQNLTLRGIHGIIQNFQNEREYEKSTRSGITHNDDGSMSADVTFRAFGQRNTSRKTYTVTVGITEKKGE